MRPLICIPRRLDLSLQQFTIKTLGFLPRAWHAIPFINW
uniref:Uncharacterized protein n=1 Tax=Arundo donax TaxID=35708 RepID=A0A0A9EXA7_ARUDO